MNASNDQSDNVRSTGRSVCDTRLFLQTLFAPYQADTEQRLSLRFLASPALVGQWRHEGMRGADIGRRQAHSAPFVLTNTGYTGAASYALCESRKLWNAYVGVLPRLHGQKDKAGVSCAAWLWAEIDGKAGGIGAAQARLALSLCDGLPHPHIVVNSGGGLHLYWRMADTARLDSEDAQATFERTLRRLSYAVGGLMWEQNKWGYTGKIKPTDPAMAYADPTCCEVARILRVPGTRNHKPERQCDVALAFLDAALPCSTYAAWRTWLPAQPVNVERPGTSKSHAPRLPGEVAPLPAKTMADMQAHWPEGTRHEALRRILHTARKCGFDDFALQTLGELFASQNACNIQWMQSLVRDTLRRVHPEC